ncbi:hypothetical protein HGM15179_006953 [Zosterops borbonicus]|uniref:Uncharacterized protein n=1 Tax=Zosterops borbonicus TaxID=364589 RepID=A0A8K1LNM3_9PASS|nr:hypothetical protein HGM15179_006953 [Zosterops borbonicus]
MFNMTQQSELAAQKANLDLGCTKSSVASRVREGILPFCSGEMRPGPPQDKKDMRPVGASPEEGHKRRVIRELGISPVKTE